MVQPGSGVARTGGVVRLNVVHFNVACDPWVSEAVDVYSVHICAVIGRL